MLHYAPQTQYVTLPNLDDLFQDTESTEINFNHSWDEAKDDPWLVFYISGTTGKLGPSTGYFMPCLLRRIIPLTLLLLFIVGSPKPLNAFRMVANMEVLAALGNIE